MKILYFFLFLLFLHSAEAIDENSFFDRILEKVKLTFDSDKKIEIELEKSYLKLNELNSNLLARNFDVIELNEKKYLDAMESVKKNTDIVGFDPEKDLDNLLRLKKWILEYGYYIDTLKESGYGEFDLFEFKINELKRILDLKLKNTEIKIKAYENQDDRVVKNMVKSKERYYGVYDVEKDILHSEVVKRLRFLKDKYNENVTIAKKMLNEIDKVEIEKGEEILEEVDKLSYE